MFVEARQRKPLLLNFKAFQALKVSAIGFVILTSLYFINQFNLAAYFPIRTVHIYGAKHITPDRLQDLLQPLVTKGYFNLNVARVRERLLQLSWVNDIYVRRNWPDQVIVTIKERNPIALWNTESILSDEGELFAPRKETYPKNLPVFTGPAGKQITMLKYFNDINRILSPLHAKISTLELTSFLTWTLTLDNGITLYVGHKDILTRLNHFVKVYPKIVGARANDVNYIDLRYPNGLAIRWKEPVNT